MTIECVEKLELVKVDFNEDDLYGKARIVGASGVFWYNVEDNGLTLRGIYGPSAKKLEDEYQAYLQQHRDGEQS